MSDFDTLRAHRAATRETPIRTLFATDPERFARFSVQAGDLLLDFSKTAIDARALEMLLALAEARGVAARRDAMFRGEKINETEGRAVLHTALRNRSGEEVLVDGRDVMEGVDDTRARMEAFAQDLRGGYLKTPGGETFTDVVNIGIGGSDLGPAMAVQALAPYHDGPRVHFVSNVDGAHVHDVLRGLDPRRTLVIVASKTFTTTETMTNADTARGWIRDAVGEDAAGGHFAAVSSALERTTDYGIDPERVFGFEDWVGGRYSMWGPIGLSLMLAIGPERFRAFLDGAHEMDLHFRRAAPHRNMPLLLGLVGVWHANVCGHATRAILPYDQRLARLPAYLQQLDMESNGKRVTLAGDVLDEHTGPIVWGEPGTNGQHAFHQLIHQGTRVVPCEFMVAARGHEADLAHQHDLLLANCLAQSEALMLGRPQADTPHRAFPGDRPSVTLIYPRLDPATLGAIVALYEHRVFVEGVIWGINSFDQWGVELGKELAKEMLPLVQGGDPAGKDGSTAGLLGALARMRQGG